MTTTNAEERGLFQQVMKRNSCNSGAVAQQEALKPKKRGSKSCKVVTPVFVTSLHDLIYMIPSSVFDCADFIIEESNDETTVAMMMIRMTTELGGP